MTSFGTNLPERDLHDDQAANSGRATMDKEDIMNCISTMLRQEEHYVCHDYLGDDQAAAAPQHAVDESCRSKMCEWIFHVIDSTGMKRETAGVAMSFLDRFLCSSSERAARARMDRKEYQLAAMTCMYIAVKIGEPKEIDAASMSRLSRGLHSSHEITACECDILIALRWRVNGPTPLQFVNYLLELLPLEQDSSATMVAAVPALYENSRFQTELAAGDYALVPNLRPSTVAIASILNSLGGIQRDDSGAYDECVRFVRSISDAFDLDIDSPLVNAVRERLLESFAKSSGHELLGEVVPIPRGGAPPNDNEKVGRVFEVFDESPACVSKEMAISLGGFV